MLLKQLKCLRSVVPMLLLLLTGVCSYPTGSVPNRLKCYVCGGESAESCGDRTSKPSEASLQECPETAQGCLTQAEGKKVTRSCVDLRIKDCKTANGNLYCYCNTDACNSEPVPASIGNTQNDDGDDLVPRHQISTNSTSKLRMDVFGGDLESGGQSNCEGDDEDLACDGSGSEPENRSNDHLIEAKFFTMPATSRAAKEDTTTYVDVENTTRGSIQNPTLGFVEKSTPRSVEKTTRGSAEAPTEGTTSFTAIEATVHPNKEPSRGCAFTSLLPLLIAAIVSVRFGNGWLLRN